MTTISRAGKKVGRKSYAQSSVLAVFLAQKYHRNGERPLRDVARLLAYIGLRPRGGKIYGPAAIRKMVRTQLTKAEQVACVRYWEQEGRSEIAEYILGVWTEPKWMTAPKRNKRRQCFQWLKE
jgi:hypothetical protein